MNYTPSTQVIEEIKSPNRTLVIFSAEWCGPCRGMNPMLDKAVEDGHRIFKIDADNDIDYGATHNVRALPTFFVYENGEQLKRHSGKFNSLVDLVNFIQS
jgi:thioredoxin 1